MDLKEILSQLYAEKELLDEAIRQLEALTKGTASRRGRKSMSIEERRQVSERMRSYWAKRRRPPNNHR
jgi:hypothetical protein